MGPKELYSTIQKNKFLPVYLLYGQDDFLIDRAVQLIADAALADSERSFNYDLLDNKDETRPDQVVAVTNAFPIMSDRRVVVVKYADKVYNREPLAKYIQSPSPQTILILCAEELKSKTRKSTATKSQPKFDAFAYLQDKNAAVQFKRMREIEALAWVKERFAEEQRTISDAAAHRLVELKGTSSRELWIEAEKIALSIAEKRTIEESDVLELSGHSKEYNIFELTDAIGTRSFDRAIEILSHLLDANEPAVGIVAMIVRHYTMLWKIQALARRRASRVDYLKEAGILEFQIDSLTAQAKLYSPRQLFSCFSALVDADLTLKSQPTDPRLVLTTLVYRLTHTTTGT